MDASAVKSAAEIEAEFAARYAKILNWFEVRTLAKSPAKDK